MIEPAARKAVGSGGCLLASKQSSELFAFCWVSRGLSRPELDGLHSAGILAEAVHRCAWVDSPEARGSELLIFANSLIPSCFN